MGLAAGTMVNANVRLLEPLGKGGMGSVWIAEHLGLQARVAVKFLAIETGADPSFRQRFKREATIGAKLRSLHVVQTFDHGVMDDGRPYIVMELLEGTDLTHAVMVRGPMGLRDVSLIVSQVAKVLERAHALGIVHRDIKPDNIFLADSDYELFVKVLDFGVAKLTSAHRNEAMTKTGAVVGTPEFMSPEQAIASKAIDHRSDLYTLGLVAHYALTGALPFDPDSDVPLWMQMTGGLTFTLSRRLPHLPPGIDDWFARSLAPKPEGRFQSARTMAEALQALVDDRQSGNYPAQAHSLSDSSTSGTPGVRQSFHSLPPYEPSHPSLPPVAAHHALASQPLEGQEATMRMSGRAGHGAGGSAAAQQPPLPERWPGHADASGAYAPQPHLPMRAPTPGQRPHKSPTSTATIVVVCAVAAVVLLLLLVLFRWLALGW